MHVDRGLTLSIALGVTTALLAACSNGGAPTSPDPAQAEPSFAKKQIWYHDNYPSLGGCRKWGPEWSSNYRWFLADTAAARKVDRNFDQFVCYKTRT
jgi:hypothetical protein